MRRTQPPELSVTGLSENIPRNVHGAVKRAIVIGNGCAGAENQCFGLVRSLGLFDRHLYYVITVQNTIRFWFLLFIFNISEFAFTVQSVARPRCGINRYLQWLPISLYKRIHHFIRSICAGFSINATGRT